jgi:hypothetical protein
MNEPQPPTTSTGVPARLNFESIPYPRLIVQCALPLVLGPLFEWLTVARYGSMLFVVFSDMLGLLCLIAFAELVTIPILYFSGHSPGAIARCLVGSLVLVFSLWGGFLLASLIRRSAFEELAIRSRPLVAAIVAYQTAHGAPPGTLEDLVPTFLPEVPGTEMAAYPQYHYNTGKSAANFEGNPWVLIVSCPSGMINFDTFMYFPLQNYPPSGFGGGIEKIDAWGYVHE